MIVHFSICFSVHFSLVRLITFDSSLVLILFLFVSWVNRCRLFRWFRVFCQVCQHGQWSCSRLPSSRRRAPEIRRRWNHLSPFQSRRQRKPAYTMHLSSSRSKTHTSTWSAMSLRQHPASPFSVYGLFLVSVFRSFKFRRSSTVLQVLGRDEGPGSSKENSASP